MRLNLTILLGNDAMQTPLDIAGALGRLADDMRSRTAGNPNSPIELHPFGSCAGTLRDDDGNRVGSWQVKA